VADNGVDDLERLYAESAGEPYRFTWAGQQWTLPHLRELDFKILAKLEKLDPATADEASVNELFDDIMDAEQGPAFRETHRPLPFLLLLLDRWTKHSGAEPGESSASSKSSPSTGTRSRRTSTGSTASASQKPSKAAKRAPRKVAAKQPADPGELPEARVHVNPL
jgi:hypothetical protein